MEDRLRIARSLLDSEGRNTAYDNLHLLVKMDRLTELEWVFWMFPDEVPFIIQTIQEQVERHGSPRLYRWIIQYTGRGSDLDVVLNLGNLILASSLVEQSGCTLPVSFKWNHQTRQCLRLAHLSNMDPAEIKEQLYLHDQLEALRDYPSIPPDVEDNGLYQTRHITAPTLATWIWARDNSVVSDDRLRRDLADIPGALQYYLRTGGEVTAESIWTYWSGSVEDYHWINRQWGTTPTASQFYEKIHLDGSAMPLIRQLRSDPPWSLEDDARWQTLVQRMGFYAHDAEPTYLLDYLQLAQPNLNQAITSLIRLYTYRARHYRPLSTVLKKANSIYRYIQATQDESLDWVKGRMIYLSLCNRYLLADTIQMIGGRPPIHHVINSNKDMLLASYSLDQIYQLYSDQLLFLGKLNDTLVMVGDVDTPEGWSVTDSYPPVHYLGPEPDLEAVRRRCGADRKSARSC